MSVNSFHTCVWADYLGFSGKKPRIWPSLPCCAIHLVCMHPCDYWWSVKPLALYVFFLHVRLNVTLTCLIRHVPCLSQICTLTSWWVETKSLSPSTSSLVCICLVIGDVQLSPSLGMETGPSLDSRRELEKQYRVWSSSWFNDISDTLFREIYKGCYPEAMPTDAFRLRIPCITMYW